jgi:hypothetical protein
MRVQSKGLSTILLLTLAGCSSAARRDDPRSPPIRIGAMPVFIAGTVDGSMSVGRQRVVTNPPPTKPGPVAPNPPQDKRWNMFIGRLDGTGGTVWLRSFAGIAPGRAVAYAPLGMSGVVAVGVFEREMLFDRQQKLTTTRAGLLFVKLSPEGRVEAATRLAEAVSFEAPELRLDGETAVVRVPFRGQPEVMGKGPQAGDAGTLDLAVSLKGEVGKAEVVAPIKLPEQKAPGGGGVRPAMFDDVGGGKPVKAAMLMMQQCNACVPGTAACRGVACVQNNVCNTIDPWCCASGWDRQCMDEAMGFCPSDVGCTCPHSPMATGAWMHTRCSPGTPWNTCVNHVVGLDWYCGSSAWDGVCVSQCPDPNTCR